MSAQRGPGAHLAFAQDAQWGARIAIDLGAESCRVSLLTWQDGQPRIELVHRIPNGPVHVEGGLHWPLEAIFSGLEEGLRKAAQLAPQGIASIAVDGWAVDYVRLGANRRPIGDPYCYRDERTVKAKQLADSIVASEWMFRHTGAQPLRINTLYQLLADRNAGIDPGAPWVNLPEYVLHRLGGRPVAEYTNATHTGLVDLQTGEWSQQLLDLLHMPSAAQPPIVPPGTVIGKLQGPLAELPAFRDTVLIAPACHDTASAVAGIPASLDNTAYICSGTWSLVGMLLPDPITSDKALAAGFTNQGAAGGGFCFHTNVNGLWILKQCIETWRKDGRPWEVAELIRRAAACDNFPGTVPVDAAPLLLDGNMPALINQQLRAGGFQEIEDRAGNEPIFARVIFESLASRYAITLQSLEQIAHKSINRIHVLGGGSLNALLTRLTAERTGLPVETGSVESSTLGNFAVQLAAIEAAGEPIRHDAVQRWAATLCSTAGIQKAEQTRLSEAG